MLHRVQLHLAVPAVPVYLVGLVLQRCRRDRPRHLGLVLRTVLAPRPGLVVQLRLVALVDLVHLVDLVDLVDLVRLVGRPAPVDLVDLVGRPAPVDLVGLVVPADLAGLVGLVGLAARRSGKQPLDRSPSRNRRPC